MNISTLKLLTRMLEQSLRQGRYPEETRRWAEVLLPRIEALVQDDAALSEALHTLKAGIRDTPPGRPWPPLEWIDAAEKIALYVERRVALEARD